MKRLITGCITALVLAAMPVAAFAAAQTPAEAAASVTGQTLEAVIAQKQESGRTYGAIAADAGKLEEFKAQVRQLRLDRVKALVEQGTWTQEQADEWIAAMEQRQAACDGTGNGCGTGNGLRDGTGSGKGTGNGLRDGTGCGNGNGLCDGTGAGAGQGVRGANRGNGTGRGPGNGGRGLGRNRG